jgi:hypothetical protein
MDNSSNTSGSSFNKQDKGTKFLDQLQRVHHEFFQQPLTMKMVATKIGIDRANVCWYCRKFRKAKRLWIFKKGVCPITKHAAIYWTTNPELVPPDSQTKLF